MVKTGLTVLSLLAVVAVATLWSLFRLNQFQSYPAADIANCETVIGVAGVEDVVTDTVSGMAWLSSMQGRGLKPGAEGQERGAIIAFDPENPLALGALRDRTGGVPQDFAPLGMDLYARGNTRRLFVVNGAAPNVLIYTMTGRGGLALIDTLTDRRLTSPGDIVAVGPRSFYVTNSASGAHGSFLAGAQYLTGQAAGSVLYYDGNSWSEAADGLKFANGIALSPDGARLYVAESAARRIRIFERDRAMGYLTPAEETIGLGSFPHTLSWKDDDTLLAGAVPKPLAFAGHASGRMERAPSRLMEIDLNQPARPRQTFVDDGSALSGLTVGAPFNGKLLLGSFAENKFRLCNGPVPIKTSNEDS